MNVSIEEFKRMSLPLLAAKRTRKMIGIWREDTTKITRQRAEAPPAPSSSDPAVFVVHHDVWRYEWAPG